MMTIEVARKDEMNIILHWFCEDKVSCGFKTTELTTFEIPRMSPLARSRIDAARP